MVINNLLAELKKIGQICFEQGDNKYSIYETQKQVGNETVYTGKYRIIRDFVLLNENAISLTAIKKQLSNIKNGRGNKF